MVFSGQGQHAPIGPGDPYRSPCVGPSPGNGRSEISDGNDGNKAESDSGSALREVALDAGQLTGIRRDVSTDSCLESTSLMTPLLKVALMLS